MRRRYKRVAKKFVKRHDYLIFVLILIPSILCMATGYSLLNSTKNINGTAKIVNDNIVEDDVGEICEVSLDYSTNFWSTNPLTGMLTINMTNNSDEDMTSWKLKLIRAVDGNITADWATKIELGEDGYYYVMPTSEFISNIPAGGSVSFTLTISANSSELTEDDLKNFIVTSCGRTVVGEQRVITNGNASLTLFSTEYPLDVEVTLAVINQYGAGYNVYNIALTNNRDVATRSWRGSIDYGDMPFRSVTAYVESQDTELGLVNIKNKGDTYFVTGEIPPGETLVIELRLDTLDTEFLPKCVFAALDAL